MEEELISMDDNIIPEIEIDFHEDRSNQQTESDLELSDDNLAIDSNVNNNVNNNNVISNDMDEMRGYATRLRYRISDFLGLDQRVNNPIDDPCPLYFISIVTLIYFPIGILIMLITCCGFKLDPQQQPKKLRAYKFMMFTTLIRIGFQLLLTYTYGMKYALYFWVFL